METTLVQQPARAGEETGALGGASDRRADIDAKMGRVAALLGEIGCEGLLLLEPDNFAWLTSGATHRGSLDVASSPVVYCNGEARWLLSANTDSHRLFDEEVDGLGFQLKEWPWHWGRDQLLADLCQNRRIACDRPFGDTKHVADHLGRLRRLLTPYEQACQRELGKLIGHALEATSRAINVGETEREAVGQVVHRLAHRGAVPLLVGAAADGRSRAYRQFGFTSTPIQKYAVLHATARKYGLTASASRAVAFGAVDENFRKDHNAVCRVMASYLASTWPDAVPREILLAGRRIYMLAGYEHEWALAPQGHLTGRLPVELAFSARGDELFQVGQAVVWCASAGAANACDTYHVTDQGPQLITPADNWPLKRIRIQGAEFVRPDILQR